MALLNARLRQRWRASGRTRFAAGRERMRVSGAANAFRELRSGHVRKHPAPG